jgi:hypothetical protein
LAAGPIELGLFGQSPASNLSQSFAIPILEIDERGHLLTEAVFDLGPARP